MDLEFDSKVYFFHLDLGTKKWILDPNFDTKMYFPKWILDPKVGVWFKSQYFDTKVDFGSQSGDFGYQSGDLIQKSTFWQKSFQSKNGYFDAKMHILIQNEGSIWSKMNILIQICLASGHPVLGLW